MNHPLHPQSSARISGHPLHPMLIPFPLVFFISAFATDLVFLVTGDAAWAVGSKWMLIAGLATATLAAVTGFADFAGDPRIRRIKKAWGHMIGNVTAVVLEAANLLIRLGDDPAASIEPTGMVLSSIVVAILAYTGWAGGELVYRHGVAVADDKLEGNGNGSGPPPHGH